MGSSRSSLRALGLNRNIFLAKVPALLQVPDQSRERRIDWRGRHRVTKNGIVREQPTSALLSVKHQAAEFRPVHDRAKLMQAL